MTGWSLTKIKNQLSQTKTLILAGAGILVIFIIIIIIAFSQSPKPVSNQPQNLPPSIKNQPVVGGKFDQNALASQRSKAAVDHLRPYLIYRNTITTSTGNKVTLALFTKPVDPYTLFVETVGVNFQSGYDDPGLAKNVQDFRDTTEIIFDFLKQHSTQPGDLFISWGRSVYIQNNAEAWLVISDQYPKVIQRGGEFVFENEPLKP